MDKVKTRCDENTRELVRELLISISYTMPDKDLNVDVPLKTTNVKALSNGNIETEKYISELISISNNECPGVNMCPGTALGNHEG